MIIELSKDELEVIMYWYHSASGESASGLSVSPRSQYRQEYKHAFDEDLAYAKRVKAVLDKLGLEYTDHDKYSMAKVGLL